MNHQKNMIIKKTRQPPLRIKIWRSDICTNLTATKRTWHNIAPRLKQNPHFPASQNTHDPNATNQNCKAHDTKSSSFSSIATQWGTVLPIKSRKVEGIDDLVEFCQDTKDIHLLFICFFLNVIQKTTKVQSIASIESGWIGMTCQAWALQFPKPKLPNLGFLLVNHTKLTQEHCQMSISLTSIDMSLGSRLQLSVTLSVSSQGFLWHPGLFRKKRHLSWPNAVSSHQTYEFSLIWFHFSYPFQGLQHIFATKRISALSCYIVKCADAGCLPKKTSLTANQTQQSWLENIPIVQRAILWSINLLSTFTVCLAIHRWDVHHFFSPAMFTCWRARAPSTLKTNDPVYLCHRSLLWSLCFGYNGRLPWLERLGQKVCRNSLRFLTCFWRDETIMNLDIRLRKRDETWRKKLTDTGLFGTRLRNVISTDASLVTSGKTDQIPKHRFSMEAFKHT